MALGGDGGSIPILVEAGRVTLEVKLRRYRIRGGSWSVSARFKAPCQSGMVLPHGTDPTSSLGELRVRLVMRSHQQKRLCHVQRFG
jgi:hypothetical protein